MVTERNDSLLSILAAVAEVTDALLRTPDWRVTLPGALRTLGRATGVSRVYYFENEAGGEETGLLASLRAEWCAPGVEPQLHQPELQGVPYEAAGMGRWREVLSRGDPIQGTLDEFPNEERPLLEPQGILSLVVVPVLSQRDWKGFIGFDDCNDKRRWAPATVDVLRAVAGSVGAAMEREAATARLAESEESYRSLFSQLAEPVLILDRDGTVVTLNEAAAALYDASAEELVGCAFEVLCHEMEGLAELLAAGLAGASVRREGLGRTPAGEVFPKEICVAPGSYFGRDVILVVERDMRDFRRLQEQLLQAQRLEAVGKLAGGIAHDFNNMLTAIQGFAGFLDSEPLSEEGRDALLEVQRAASRSVALTRQLLAFSRKQVMAAQELDLSHALAGVQKLMARLIPTSVEVVWELAGEPLPIQVDPGQLDQTVINLVVNARDAMDGRGRLVIRTARQTFTQEDPPPLSMMPVGEYAVLQVSDDGQGIDEATAARIFEPFFTTKEVGRGTGLGLSTVYGIVKQSGGFITVDSRPGEGATFRVFLPLLPAAAAVQASSPEPSETGDLAAPEVRVLLVEDEDAVRSLIARILRRQGIEVREAASGDEALQALETMSPDLLVTDVVMPGLGGAALVERARELRPGLPVLAISGYTDDASRRDLQRAGRVDFLGKPFSPKELVTAVRTALE